MVVRIVSETSAAAERVPLETGLSAEGRVQTWRSMRMFRLPAAVGADRLTSSTRDTGGLFAPVDLVLSRGCHDLLEIMSEYAILSSKYNRNGDEDPLHTRLCTHVTVVGFP